MPDYLILIQEEIKRVISAVMLILVFSVPAPAAVHAQEQGPGIEYIPAWQGYTRVPGWVEVEFILTRESEPWEGTLLIQDSQNEITYRSPVTLPQHSRKSIRVPVFSADGFGFTAKLVSDGTTQNTVEIPLQPYRNGRICAVMGTGVLHSALTKCDTLLYLQSLAELPETPMVWDNVDVLLINGENTRGLSDKQMTGMLAWVSSGGHLIVSGGIGLNLALNPLVSQLRITAAGPVIILDELPGISMGSGKIASAQLTSSAASRVLVESAGSPLSVSQSVGKGTVDVIGWDIFQVDSDQWLQTLWNSDPIPATAIQIFGPQATSARIGPSVYELQQLTDNPVTGMWLWSMLFALYVVLIGPVTLWVVRKLNKPLSAWIIIPGWIVIALILMSIVLTSSYGRLFPMIHDIAFISLNGKGLPARVIQGTAITAPQSRTIAWSTPGYIRPLWGLHAANTWAYTGAPYPFTVSYESGAARLTTSRPGGMLTWAIEGLVDNIALNAELSLTPGLPSPVIQGEIYSDIELHLLNLVWMGSSQQTIRLTDQLQAGHTNVISATLPPLSTYPDPTYVVCDMSELPFRTPMVKPIEPLQLEDTVEPTCYITAEATQVPFPTQDIAGSYTGESCLIQSIDCPVQSPGPVKVNLRPTSNGNDGGWVDAQMEIVAPNPPASIFTYSLPDYINILQISSMSISIQTVEQSVSQSAPEFILSLWDWQAKLWVEQSLENTSTPNVYSLNLLGNHAERFFDMDSESTKLQLTVPGNNYLQYHLPISIEGIW